MKAIGNNRTTEKLEVKFESVASKANNPFQYWVDKTREALGKKPDGSEYSFGQICGLISNWGDKRSKVAKLKERYNVCKKADIPFAPLWWHLHNENKRGNS